MKRKFWPGIRMGNIIIICSFEHFLMCSLYINIIFTLVKEVSVLAADGLSAGPSGIKNFNPGIFRDGILPNPGIPGFFGTGFPNIFYPRILLKSFGIFRDFHLCLICLTNWIIFITIYHHHRHNHHQNHCHSSSLFIEIIISD